MQPRVSFVNSEQNSFIHSVFFSGENSCANNAKWQKGDGINSERKKYIIMKSLTGAVTDFCFSHCAGEVWMTEKCYCVWYWITNLLTWLEKSGYILNRIWVNKTTSLLRLWLRHIQRALLGWIDRRVSPCFERWENWCKCADTFPGLTGTHQRIVFFAPFYKRDSSYPAFKLHDHVTNYWTLCCAMQIFIFLTLTLLLNYLCKHLIVASCSELECYYYINANY